MRRKLSKSTLALIFFTLTLVLSVAGLFVMSSIYHPTYAIYATKYGSVPTSYVVVDYPDRYVLEAITNGHSSTFNSLDYTQIDELTSEHPTWNIKYNNDYYSISILYGDNIPPFLLPLALLSGIIASLIAIVMISIYEVAKHMKSKLN